ncbi:hypothetical protein KJ951_00065, partial [Patescibacteria group bacterium]|nr:hypothetical protein [Patescibacteria group bacterium]
EKSCDEKYNNTSKNVESSACTEDANGIVEVTITAPMTEKDKDGKSTEKKVTLRVKTDNKNQQVGLNSDWQNNLNVISTFGRDTAKVASEKAEIYNAFPVAFGKAASRPAPVAQGKTTTKTPGGTTPGQTPAPKQPTTPLDKVPQNTELSSRVAALETRTTNVEAKVIEIDVKVDENTDAIAQNKRDIEEARKARKAMLSRLAAIKANEERAKSGN